MDWNPLVDALDPAQVVSDDHAPWRPLARDGLVRFLELLPARRQRELLAAQLALPATAATADRLLALLHACPTLHKLGQVLARDHRLAPSLRGRLQSLESRPPTTSVASVRPALRAALGRSRGLRVARTALAEASVALVVPFSYPTGRGLTRGEGVFKLVKPGVRERLDDELAAWGELAPWLEERCSTLGLAVLDLRGTVDDVRRSLADEVRLDRERDHLALAAAFHQRSPGVLVPKLLPWCTADVTAMERLHGCKVTEVAGLQPGRRRAVAEHLVTALVARPFFTTDDEVLFHADPHAGNLMLCSEDRVALLDWCLVARLTRRQRVALMQMVLGGLTLDPGRVSRALEELCLRPPRPEPLGAAVTAALRQVRRGTVPGFRWLVDLVDRAVAAGAVSLAEGPVLFRKALLSLEGVVADVSDQASPDRVVLAHGLRALAGETPWRALLSPGSRDLGTHVSTLDLLEVLTAGPLTWLRFWNGCLEDSLASPRGRARAPGANPGRTS